MFDSAIILIVADSRIIISIFNDIVLPFKSVDAIGIQQKRPVEKPESISCHTDIPVVSALFPVLIDSSTDIDHGFAPDSVKTIVEYVVFD